MEQDKSGQTYPDLVYEIVKGMENVKASGIMVLDLSGLENSVCDYFVIAEGTSNTQVNAISDSIEKIVRETLHEKPWHVEGKDNSEWILMDYVSVVAHVFQKHTRGFYDLESLWGDAKVTAVNVS